MFSTALRVSPMYTLEQHLRMLTHWLYQTKLTLLHVVATAARKESLCVTCDILRCLALYHPALKIFFDSARSLVVSDAGDFSDFYKNCRPSEPRWRHALFTTASQSIPFTVFKISQNPSIQNWYYLYFLLLRNFKLFFFASSNMF